ncbi:MAG TPA: sigma-54 dependent transcriptional regulator [Pyrinomonadaceae bacterium]|jgi:DNA-binding NtrC family response regulator
MTLAETMLRQLDNPKLSRDERARRRCQLAEELEDRGQYEAARNALGELWQGIGTRPAIEGFSGRTVAEVLLRAGTLSGWLGSAAQITDAQAVAKDLITESITLFESLGETSKVTVARSDLALCYWREGAFDEARALLEDVYAHLDESDIKVRARTLLRRILIEVSTGRLNDALRLLTDDASIFEASEDHILKGRFHGQLALVLMGLGTAEHRTDYMDRAVIEYSAASYHFEQAGQARFRASDENNLGFLLFIMRRYDEASKHLSRARRLFVSLKDSGRTAQVDETRTRLLLAQGRNTEAEKVIRGAVRILENGGEQSLLAEALTTQGVVLARLGRYDLSYKVLQRAMNIAEQAGALEYAGRAALTFLEEHAERIAEEERREVYLRADGWLAGTQDAEDISRLRACARRAMSPGVAVVQEGTAPVSFVHASEETAALLEQAQRLARTNLPILITGETGVGKEVLARLIHYWSGRSGAFVPVNCGALTESLIESQLFGHRKGSFTDAVTDYPGAIREAEGGTLLLDEIGELSQGNQGKLLRFIELGEIMPVGAPAPEYVDVRIIASTNVSLSKLVARRRFREDLFYRIATFEVDIPPLRERPSDIIALAEHFIEQAAEHEGKPVNFAPGCIEVLRSLPLHGNARELRNIIERAVISAKGQPISEEAFKLILLRTTGKGRVADPWEDFSLSEEVRLYEERLIERALKESHGRITHAARLLGLSHQTLSAILESRHRRLQQLRTPVEPRRRSIIKRK